MRRNEDIVLAISIAGSIFAGILLANVGLQVEPYLLVWLGALLFLNLIKLKISDLVVTFTKPTQIVVLSAVKLIALPLVMYYLAYVIYKPFVLPVLLLSGISTGLGAPFVVNLIGGRLSLVVGMIISTSIAVPFVLPLIVYELMGSQFSIPILQMIFLLSVALFTPLAAGWVVKKQFPTVLKFADERSFPLSLIFIVLINFGMFAKFSNYFYTDQLFMLQTIATAFLCYTGYGLTGYVLASLMNNNRNTKFSYNNAINNNNNSYETTAGLISMSYINNVLVAVFALQFFGPTVAALAALYNIPYYAGIVALRKIISKA